MTAYRIIKKAAKEAPKEAEVQSDYEVRAVPPAEETTKPEEPTVESEQQESIVDIMLSSRAWRKMA
jgi:hypothetical protein